VVSVIVVPAVLVMPIVAVPIVIMPIVVMPIVVMPIVVVALVAVEPALVAAVVVVVVVVVRAPGQPRRTGGEQTEGADAEHFARHKRFLVRGVSARRNAMPGVLGPDPMNQTPAAGDG
jgi:hypothetical protein